MLDLDGRFHRGSAGEPLLGCLSGAYGVVPFRPPGLLLMMRSRARLRLPVRCYGMFSDSRARSTMSK